MSEERLDRIEALLNQLFDMVLDLQKMFAEMREERRIWNQEHKTENQDVDYVKQDQETMREELDSVKQGYAQMRIENEERHNEIMDRITNLEMSQKVTWDKASENEMEIRKIKKQ